MSAIEPNSTPGVSSDMTSLLQLFAADHRYLMDAVARQAGFANPVAVDLDEFYTPLVKAPKKAPALPIDGFLVRDGARENRRFAPGFQLGMRSYEIEGVRFVRVRFHYEDRPNVWGLDFIAVDQKD